MTNDDRYIQMACACSAQWIEDRMEPGSVCPSCTHYEPWPLVENCKRLGVCDPGQFDVSAAPMIEFLESCGFRCPSKTIRSSGKTKTGCWTYSHKDGSASWTILGSESLHGHRCGPLCGSDVPDRPQARPRAGDHQQPPVARYPGKHRRHDQSLQRRPHPGSEHPLLWRFDRGVARPHERGGVRPAICAQGSVARGAIRPLR